VTSPGKIIKNGLNVFERGENLLQNGISQFVFRVSQSILRNRAFAQTKNEKTNEKLTFLKKFLALKGLIIFFLVFLRRQ